MANKDSAAELNFVQPQQWKPSVLCRFTAAQNSAAQERTWLTTTKNLSYGHQWGVPPTPCWRRPENYQQNPTLYHSFLTTHTVILFYRAGVILVNHAGVSNPWPKGHMQPRMTTNAAQHKIVNLLKTFFFCPSVFVSVCVFNVWPKTTLLPIWPRDAKRLDTPAKSKQKLALKTNQ